MRLCFPGAAGDLGSEMLKNICTLHFHQQEKFLIIQLGNNTGKCNRYKFFFTNPNYSCEWAGESNLRETAETSFVITADWENRCLDFLSMFCLLAQHGKESLTQPLPGSLGRPAASVHVWRNKLVTRLTRYLEAASHYISLTRSPEAGYSNSLWQGVLCSVMPPSFTCLSFKTMFTPGGRH